MNRSAPCDAGTAPVPGLHPSLAEAPAEPATAAALEGQPEPRFEDLLPDDEPGQEPAETDPAEAASEVPLVSPCPIAWIAPPPPLLPPPQLPQTPPAQAEPPSAAAPPAIPSPPPARAAGAAAISASPPLPENILPAPSRAHEPGAEQIAAKPRNSAPEGSGMPAAQRQEMVFTTSMHGENASAEPREQALGIEYQQTPEFEPELAPETKPARAARAAAPESLDSAPSLLPASPARMDREATAFELAPPAEAARVAARTLEAIDGHVQLLRSTGQERLEVILKPDGATAIHLEVTRADGQIQVQARCERGHFAALEAQWSALQSALAVQGIRLEPLQASSSLGHSGGQFLAGQHGQRSPRDQGEPSHPFLVEQDMPHPGRAAGAQPRGWPSRGWQRWA